MTNINISRSFDRTADVVLFEGDTLNFLRSIPENFFKLVVTSPPYNLGKPYEKKVRIEEYLEQQGKVIEQCVRVLDPHGSICWQVGNYVNDGEILPLDILLFPIFSNLGLHLRNRIIWHFGHGLHTSKRFSGRYEVILWFTKTEEYVFNLNNVRVPQKYPNKKYFKGPKKGELSGNPLGKNPSDVWDIPNVKANHIEKTIHPCQFPVELIERLILSLTNENDWVLDPFLGVGTTAVSALIHGRKAMGAEIMHEYNEITEHRLKLAADGKLLIRPMERPVYDPGDTIYIPPKKVQISRPMQPRLIAEKKKKFGEEK
jgi:adenine-specific DNA-methyltransferase